MAGLMAMGGHISASPPLRTTVSAALTTRVRYIGMASSVRVSISQIGAIDFFDRPLNDRLVKGRRAVVEALDAMAERIATRAGR